MTGKIFNKEKFTIKTVIVGILVGILFIGGTYALVRAILAVYNGRYAYQSACFNIRYDISNGDGTRDIGGTLTPSARPDGGLTGKVTMGIDPSCNVRARGNLYLNIASSSSILTQTVDGHCEREDTLETLPGYKDEKTCSSVPGYKWVTDGTALKYAIYEGEAGVPVSVGYIKSDMTQINMYKEFELLDLAEYNIYIWLDGHMSDNTYENLSFSASISADASQYMVNPEAPRLDEGMIPITINAYGDPYAISPDDPDWYDYYHKEWANAVLVANGVGSNYVYDLSKGTNGTYYGVAGQPTGTYEWVHDGLNFTGSGGVKLRSIDVASMSSFTFEVDFTTSTLNDSFQTVFSNAQAGGFYVAAKTAFLRVAVYDAGYGGYRLVEYSNPTENTRYLVTGVYEDSELLLYVNGEYIGATSFTGAVKNPDNSTIAFAGCDPKGSACEFEYFSGTIHSVKFYNTALYDNQIKNNYLGNVEESDLYFWYDFEDGRRLYYKRNPGVWISNSDILAYYVWIPRYKYRIPYKTCGEVPASKRNMEDYPECYAPYVMSKSDKEKLVLYYEGEKYCAESSKSETITYSLNVVNYALQNGKFLFELGYLYGLSITSWVEAYNNGESKDCGEPDGTQLTLTPSAFNENNRLTGKGNEVSIDIEFESVNDSLSRGDAINTYYTHPAFTWDGEAVSGIWVGKFETTPDKSDACYTKSSKANCNDTTQNPTILPNEAPLVNQHIGNQFITSQNFTKSGNVYGLSNGTTDGHMMKNSEWGAVAYLSHSIYGINKEITTNNYYSYNSTTEKSFKTGCGALDGVTSSAKTCTNAYSTDGLTTYPQSTTGNITGVFDMSGGASEYVMGNYDNTINTYFPTLPDNKYYDIYPASQFTGAAHDNMVFCTLETCGGHALLETAGWYNNYASFCNSYSTWFRRSNTGFGSDGAWGSDSAVGDGGNISWRSVIVVGNGTKQCKVLYGDANCDGIVNNKDVDIINKYDSGGSVKLSSVGKFNGDVNFDGAVDDLDADLIQQYIDGTIASLPVR